ncbi:hypothetical protein Tco_0669444 [Tanacetum coccineum]
MLPNKHVAGEAFNPQDVDSDADIYGLLLSSFIIGVHLPLLNDLLPSTYRNSFDPKVKGDHDCLLMYSSFWKDITLWIMRRTELNQSEEEVLMKLVLTCGYRIYLGFGVAKVVPDAATKLIHSDEMGMLVAKLVKASIIYGRCAAFDEVANLKEPFIMEKMDGYRPTLTL